MGLCACAVHAGWRAVGWRGSALGWELGVGASLGSAPVMTLSMADRPVVASCVASSFRMALRVRALCTPLATHLDVRVPVPMVEKPVLGSVPAWLGSSCAARM